MKYNKMSDKKPVRGSVQLASGSLFEKSSAKTFRLLYLDRFLMKYPG